MSRRHTDIVTGEVLPEGCIFYAPLTQGDFKDHVSGATMIHNTNVGTVTWDATHNMYNFTQTNGQRNCCIGYWNTDFAPYFQGLYSESYTMYARVVVTPSGGRPYLVGLGNFNTDSVYKPNLQCPSFGGWSTNTPVTTPTGGAIGRRGSDGYLLYWPKDFYDSSQTATTSKGNPANWDKTTNHCLDRVCVHLCRDNGYLNMTFLIQNLMVFNRYLDQSELTQLATQY